MIKETKGFGLVLTETEQSILSSFSSDGTLVWPAGQGLTDSVIKKTLRELVRKQYVTKTEEDPYKLTKLGLKVVKGQKSHGTGNKKHGRIDTKKPVLVTTAQLDTSGAR